MIHIWHFSLLKRIAIDSFTTAFLSVCLSLLSLSHTLSFFLCLIYAWWNSIIYLFGLFLIAYTDKYMNYKQTYICLCLCSLGFFLPQCLWIIAVTYFLIFSSFSQKNMINIPFWIAIRYMSIYSPGDITYDSILARTFLFSFGFIFVTFIFVLFLCLSCRLGILIWSYVPYLNAKAFAIVAIEHPHIFVIFIYDVYKYHFIQFHIFIHTGRTFLWVQLVYCSIISGFLLRMFSVYLSHLFHGLWKLCVL